MINVRNIAIIGLASIGAFATAAAAAPYGGSDYRATLDASAETSSQGPRSVNTVNTHRDWFDQTATVKASDTGGPAGVMVVKAQQKALVITDFVMTHNVNTTDGTFRVNFRRGPASNANDCDTAGLILGPYVSSAETVSINLTTGLRLEPGEQLCVAVGGASGNDGVTFSLSGYEAHPNVGP
jgi:hypothetical protein